MTLKRRLFIDVKMVDDFACARVYNHYRRWRCHVGYARVTCFFI